MRLDLLLHGGEGHDRCFSAERVDCSRLTVAPGLIDCHSHVTLLGLGKDEMERSNGLAALVWVENKVEEAQVQRLAPGRRRAVEAMARADGH